MNDLCQCSQLARSGRSKEVWLGLAAFWAAGFVLWPGCATPALPSSRTPAGSLQKADIKVAKKALTKKQVTAQLGEPDLYVEESQVACYRLNHVSRHRLILLFGVIPVGADQDNPGLEVAMFQYDAQGNVLRHDRRTVRRPYSLIGIRPGSPDSFDDMVRAEAVQWANSRPGKM